MRSNLNNAVHKANTDAAHKSARHRKNPYVFAMRDKWREGALLDAHKTTRRFGLPPNNLFQFNPETGEWQRILSGGNQRGPLLDLRPRAQRIRDELALRQKRHSELLLWLPVTGGIVALLCYLLLPLPDDPWTWGTAGTEIGHFGRPLVIVYERLLPSGPRDGWVFTIILFLGIALFAYALFYALYHGLRRSGRLLFEEFVHALGFQFIPGAKVLDPAAALPGREVVDRQKAYGDARLASEAEARAAAAQGGGRSSVHDQEF